MSKEDASILNVVSGGNKPKKTEELTYEELRKGIISTDEVKKLEALFELGQRTQSRDVVD